MTEKQKRLFELYKEIDTICKNNSIDYYMAGGTLIGVVRHRGFVPWDDDMDILMTRDNFHRFMSACKNEMPENRVLECQELNHGYHNVIARYTDSSSCAVHTTQLVHSDTAGFVVDILVLDPIPDKDEKYKKYCRDLLLYSDIVNNCIIYSYRWRQNALRYGFYRLKCKIIGRERVLNQLEDRLFCYDEDKCDYYVMRWGGAPFVFDKTLYGKGSLRDFAGVQSQVPDRVSDYLVWHYGDEWMFIPEHSQQEGHKAVYSLDTDYKTIRKDYLEFINTKSFNRTCFRHKLIASWFIAIWNPIKDMKMKRLAKQKERYFSQYFSKYKTKIDTLVETGDYVGLNEIYKEFFEVQLSAEFFGREDYSNIGRFHHPVLISLAQPLEEIAVLILLNTNRISKALRYIEVIRKIRGNVSQTLKDIESDILKFRSIVSDFAENILSNDDLRIDELIEKYPFCIGILKLKIRLLFAKNALEEEIEPFITSGLITYPQDGELLKYSTDLKDDSDSAILQDYVSAWFKTRNGIVRLEIEDILNNRKQDALELAKENYEFALELFKIIPCDEILEILYLHYKKTPDYQSAVLAYEMLSAFENTETAKKCYKDFYIKVTSEKTVAEFMTSLHIDGATDELLKKVEEAEKECKNTLINCWYNRIIAEIYFKLGQTAKAFEIYSKCIDNAAGNVLENSVRNGLVLITIIENNSSVISKIENYEQTLEKLGVNKNEILSAVDVTDLKNYSLLCEKDELKALENKLTEK